MFKDTILGEFVTLRKLEVTDFSELERIGDCEDLWRYVKPFHQSIKYFLSEYLETLVSKMEQKIQIPYVVIRNSDQRIVGSTRYYDVSVSNKRLAIGYTWYHPSVWGSFVNSETKYLLLQHVFNDLQFNRVEFHVDARNKRSIRAMTKLGATQDCILRKHKIVQGNFVRDSVLFSIVDSDWSSVEQRLAQRLFD